MNITRGNIVKCLIISAAASVFGLIGVYVMGPSVYPLNPDLLSARGVGLSFAFIFIVSMIWVGRDWGLGEIKTLLAECVSEGRFDTALDVVKGLGRDLDSEEVDEILAVCIMDGDVKNLQKVMGLIGRDLGWDELEDVVAVCVNESYVCCSDDVGRWLTRDDFRNILAEFIERGYFYLAVQIACLIELELTLDELETIADVCDRKKMVLDAAEVRLMIACTEMH